MRIVEIITVGREILDGRVIDTNAVEMAEALRPLGLTPRFGQRVDDDFDRMISAFQIAASRSKIILVTGGLGPTSDDLTAEAFARCISRPLVLNTEALTDIETIFKKIGRPVTDAQRKQALLPQDAVILKNPEGTAPGFAYTQNDILWFFMPGVPREMKRMLREQVLPRLPQDIKVRSRTWATQFTSEGMLQDALSQVQKKLSPAFELTFRTRFPENHIALYAECPNVADEKLFTQLAAEIETILGQGVFASASEATRLADLEEVVVGLLKEHGFMMATVESCTGGLLAHRLTNVSGSSAAYWGGFMTYDNSAKELAVDVPQELLKNHGAVSREVALAMAKGGLKKMRGALQGRSKNLVCISTTGIAGPTGGSAEKPVGLCFIGIARETDSGITSHCEEIRARAGFARDQYKTFFAQKALDLVRQTLLKSNL